MYVGHFAAGLALKATEPKAPTWGLLLGVGFMDILFGPFVLLGIERASVTPGGVSGLLTRLHRLVSFPRDVAGLVRPLRDSVLAIGEVGSRGHGPCSLFSFHLGYPDASGGSRPLAPILGASGTRSLEIAADRLVVRRVGSHCGGLGILRVEGSRLSNVQRTPDRCRRCVARVSYP